MLLATLKWDIPDFVIGLSGIVFIAGSIISSRRANRLDKSLPKASNLHNAPVEQAMNTEGKK